VWLDLNRDGIQDENEVGFEDVLVELRTPGQQAIDHGIETGSDGEFHFILDALDFVVGFTGDEEFYVQVQAPEGYHFSQPTDPGNGETDSVHILSWNKGTGISPSFSVTPGKTYTADAGLVLSCDPSLGYILFDGIESAVGSQAGIIELEWEPASLMLYDENDSLYCNEDDIYYDVFVAQAPFDLSAYSLSELFALSNAFNDILHLETDDLGINVDGSQSGKPFTALVIASAGGIVSEEQHQRDKTVQHPPRHEPGSDELPYDESDNIIARRQDEQVAVKPSMVSQDIVTSANASTCILMDTLCLRFSAAQEGSEHPAPTQSQDQ